jgi:hypothetical protein
MKQWKKHYRIRRCKDYFYRPEVRFLVLFWIPCALIEQRNSILPRNIRCETLKDAEKVVELYNKLNCPGREYKITYKYETNS